MQESFYRPAQNRDADGPGQPHADSAGLLLSAINKTRPSGFSRLLPVPDVLMGGKPREISLDWRPPARRSKKRFAIARILLYYRIFKQGRTKAGG